MSFASKLFVLLLSIVTVFGADKETKFDPGPIESFANLQTFEKLAVAADAYASADKTKKAFGKLNPNQYGILPVLVMMRNSSGQALTLEGMRVEYILPSRQKIEATPAREVARARGVEQPRLNRNPLPVPTSPRASVKKSPLTAWEIEGRAFAARMLPPGETASGFFYFQVSPRPGSVLYITGIQEAATRRELFYIEIPLAQ
jgi:hypothetical protein